MQQIADILGAGGARRPGQDPWPEDRPITCVHCDAVMALPGFGAEWRCYKCKERVWWGMERTICRCGQGEISGQRQGRNIFWGRCPACNPDEAKRKEELDRHARAQKVRDERKELKLQILRNAAAECLGRNPGCNVLKKSKPLHPFCRSCKGGKDA